MGENCLILFIRNPELGKVKTRLAKTMGDEAALAIYKQLLIHTYQAIKNTKCDKKIYFSKKIETLEGWNSNYEAEIQIEGDLGEKMFQSIERQLSQYNKVCIIGSDCPELTTSIIDDAFSELDKKDVVIGPANDGGYYLLGLKKLIPSIFKNMHWSSESVFSETNHRLKEENITVGILPELIDVDTEEDWKLVEKKIMTT
ncbi:MAG: TIGR04282 family arsenosugar biosynthesis glycosyltransferase [Reichenbachiella sp.]